MLDIRFFDTHPPAKTNTIKKLDFTPKYCSNAYTTVISITRQVPITGPATFYFRVVVNSLDKTHLCKRSKQQTNPHITKDRVPLAPSGILMNTVQNLQIMLLDQGVKSSSDCLEAQSVPRSTG